MKKTILSLMLFTNCIQAELNNVYNEENWIELNKIHVTKNSPTQEYRVLWMNTYSQELYPVVENYPFPGDWSEEDRWMERYGWMGHSYPHNEWITVSVADRVPESAKSIYLTGLLIISCGSQPESPDMTIKFRRKGETKEGRYTHQAHYCTHPGSVRSPMSLWVPLNEDREFEFKWTRSTYGQWPTNAAYGIALFMNAWGE